MAAEVHPAVLATQVRRVTNPDVSTTRSRVILVALLVAAGSGACSKKSKKEADRRVEPQAKDEPVSDDLRKVLSLMPKDSDMIIGLDVTTLRTASFYKAYE